MPDPMDLSEQGKRDRTTRVDARDAFDALTETIWRLRQPDGCPWDREQTHASIAKNMIEEAYEAVDCIEEGDTAHLREELGDVLMQVMLHAQIAADADEFTVEDVVNELNEKLIRRHPHVFGSATVARDTAEVLDIWDQVKLAEKASSDTEAAAGGAERPQGLLEGVPRALPASCRRKRSHARLLPLALSGKASQMCGIRLPRSAPSTSMSRSAPPRESSSSATCCSPS